MRKLTLDDLNTEKYGLLQVVKFLRIEKKKSVWLWKCDCGGFIEANANLVRTNKTKSCGCLKKQLGSIGENHNLLTAIEYSHKDNTGHSVWLWKCDCGNTVKSKLSSVRIGNRKSCGCQKKQKCSEFLRKTSRKPKGESCKNQLYGTYKRNAKYRNLDFKLSPEHFFELIEQTCVYCGQEPSNIQKVEWNDDIVYYSGLDRVNNDVGYLKENVVPCCITCNKGKRDMSKDCFLDWVEQIYNFNKKE